MKLMKSFICSLCKNRTKHLSRYVYDFFGPLMNFWIKSYHTV